MSVTFQIRETLEKGKIIFEVWRRNAEHGTECLLAEADTRGEAREILRHYAGDEERRKTAPVN